MSEKDEQYSYDAGKRPLPFDSTAQEKYSDQSLPSAHPDAQKPPTPPVSSASLLNAGQQEIPVASYIRAKDAQDAHPTLPATYPSRIGRRRFLLGAGATALAAGGLSLFAWFANHRNKASLATPGSNHPTVTPTVTPTLTPSPTPEPALDATFALSSIWMFGPDSGWAIGTPAVQTSATSVLCRCVQGRWTIAYTMNDFLTTITMTSPDEGWAVGRGILHYSQGQWQIADVPNYLFEDIAMVTPQLGFAVGADDMTHGGSPMCVIFQYDGTSWQQVALPPLANNANCNSISMLSANEGWGVGSYSLVSLSSQGLSYHYHNGAWTQVSRMIPGYADVNVQHLRFDPATNSGWASGSFASDYAGTSLLRYQNNQWHWIDMPANPMTIGDFSAIAPDDVWVTDSYSSSIWHYSQGHWQKAALPAKLKYIYTIRMTGPADGWAGCTVGEYQANTKGVILRCQNGTWQIYS